jgi:hypothetical protein
VRPPATREEVLLEEAAYYDAFAERYGWEVEVTKRQPQWFLARAPFVWQAKREVENANRG